MGNPNAEPGAVPECVQVSCLAKGLLIRITQAGVHIVVPFERDCGVAIGVIKTGVAPHGVQMAAPKLA